MATHLPIEVNCEEVQASWIAWKEGNHKLIMNMPPHTALVEVYIKTKKGNHMFELDPWSAKTQFQPWSQSFQP